MTAEEYIVEGLATHTFDHLYTQLKRAQDAIDLWQRAITSKRAKQPFEIMEANDDGWCDWIHPLPGYLMKCCDCGLVHEMQVAIGGTDDNDTVYNEGEGPERVVIFRMRRHEEAN